MASARRFILLLVVVWMVASTLRGGSVVLAAVGSTGAVLSGPEHTQRVPAGRNCDFSGQRLTRFPNLQASHKCTELYLDHNALTDIPPRAFAHIKHLRWLWLSHNKVHHLRRDMFEGLHELQILQLDSNAIGGVEADTFTNMPNLHQLAMQNNRLGKLPSTVFMAAVRMSHLDLSFNFLGNDALAAIRTVPQLEVLGLAGNRLTDVGTTFRFLPHLTVLRLDGNLLTDIPYTTFDRQVNLVELFVSGNRIRSLDPALFFPLRRLSRLKLAEMPDWDPKCKYPSSYLGEYYCAKLRGMHPRARELWMRVHTAMASTAVLIAAGAAGILLLWCCVVGCCVCGGDSNTTRATGSATGQAPGPRTHTGDGADAAGQAGGDHRTAVRGGDGRAGGLRRRRAPRDQNREIQ